MLPKQEEICNHVQVVIQKAMCVTCHKSGGVNPHPKNWKSIKNNVRDKGVSEKTCKKCHITY